MSAIPCFISLWLPAGTPAIECQGRAAVSTNACPNTSLLTYHDVWIAPLTRPSRSPAPSLVTVHGGPGATETWIQGVDYPTYPSIECTKMTVVPLDHKKANDGGASDPQTHLRPFRRGFVRSAGWRTRTSSTCGEEFFQISATSSIAASPMPAIAATTPLPITSSRSTHAADQARVQTACRH